jgi:rRNA maturation endonuclease Nob1
MSEQEESCDIRIWCDQCQLCDYTTTGDKYICASCGKDLQLDLNVHQANFTVVTDDEDQQS